MDAWTYVCLKYGSQNICLDTHNFQSTCLLWHVPDSMVSPPIWRCRLGPGRALWWPVWHLHDSLNPALHSPCHWQTGHKTQTSELDPNHTTLSRGMFALPSTWTCDRGSEMIFAFTDSDVRCTYVCLCVIYLAGQLRVWHDTTAVGLGKSLHSKSSTTFSTLSVSWAQYSTLLATPPPHVTLQTPCLVRHLVVKNIILLSYNESLFLNETAAFL